MEAVGSKFRRSIFHEACAFREARLHRSARLDFGSTRDFIRGFRISSEVVLEPGAFVFLTNIQPLIAHYGYAAVFLIVMLESAGLPLPGETALLLAAGYAGATGELHLPLVIASAASGAIIGDNVGFWVGRKWGAELLRRHGKFILMDEGRIRLGQYLFERHGAKIVFFGRFVAFLRVLAALLAGINKYRWRPFLFYNAAGGIVWATVMGIGSYLFGDAVHRVSGPLGVAALAGVALGAIAFVVIVRIEERKLERKLGTMGTAKSSTPT